MYTIDAYAKVNIFLKITGHRNGYHTLLSRFMQVESLYDTIQLTPSVCESFTIEGCDGVPIESNTIFKAYHLLLEHAQNKILSEFFHSHKVVVTKRIPSQAGLGGGSSDAAAFMRLVNRVCDLGIDTDELASLGSQIGADLPFFIYNYPSANVTGFGEIVTPFEESLLDLEIFTPSIGCDTTLVYKTFKQHLLEHISLCSFVGWEKLESRTLLETIADPIVLNDLYAAARIAYPDLESISPTGWYFSGSGSSFFRLK